MNRAARRRKKRQAGKTQQLEQPDAMHKQELFNQAIFFHQNDRLDEAVVRYRRFLDIEPENCDALCNLGAALCKQGHLNAAVKLFKKTISLYPDNSIAHSNLGYALKMQDKYEDAQVSLNNALEIDPNNSDAYYNLGIVLKKQGSLESAVENIRQSLVLNPDNFEAHNDLGILFHGLGKLEESMVSFQAALTINPDYYEAHSNKGLVLNELNRLDEGVASILTALTIKPDFINAYSNLWVVLRSSLWDDIESQSKINSIIDRLTSAAPSSPEPYFIQLRLKRLWGENTLAYHQKVLDVLPTAQQETIYNQYVRKVSARRKTKRKSDKSKKMVVLLHFGRSGSGYLHTLMDGHPSISTMPGNYLRGYFGRNVWNRLVSSGYQGLPTEFANMFGPLFNANSTDHVPPAFVGEYDHPSQESKIEGASEGYLYMGENRDIPLGLDKIDFIKNLSEIIFEQESVNSGSFFEHVHDAFENTLGNDFRSKSVVFYHLHYNDPFTMLNFLKNFPSAQLLTIVREPLQSCESWVEKLASSEESHYKKYLIVSTQISRMLMDLNNDEFSVQDSAGIRLEDLKRDPENTMRRLCAWLGIEDDPSLYKSTMQGLKWWGDPTSSVYGREQEATVWSDDPIQKKVGKLFSEKDQFIIGTLFYPLRAQLGYVDWNRDKFEEDLQKVRPLLYVPLDFEKNFAEKFSDEYPELEATFPYKSFHATLIGRWKVLDEHGSYPNMLKTLPE
ncbi:MAG: tetratricopeptide repeat protein [Magnetococcales bacterium]|nr:tetratricopeptide repeat protein [Magnetococcales bacterium]